MQKLLWCAAGLAQQAESLLHSSQSDGAFVQGVFKPNRQQLELVGGKAS